MAIMEWCSHCCRLCPTTVETIGDQSSGIYYCSCNMCGKVLLDLSTPLAVKVPMKRIKRCARRIKTRRKIIAQDSRKECKYSSALLYASRSDSLFDIISTEVKILNKSDKNLAGNELSGCIPQDIGKLCNLKYLCGCKAYGDDLLSNGEAVHQLGLDCLPVPAEVSMDNVWAKDKLHEEEPYQKVPKKATSSSSNHVPTNQDLLRELQAMKRIQLGTHHVLLRRLTESMGIDPNGIISDPVNKDQWLADIDFTIPPASPEEEVQEEGNAANEEE
ncbi:hypothetical protein RJT34_11188 [Clitoria ternatea]|uniref:Uncharacterized protein n=1 Tax=Clitoria ternatea TaxID=43366 RepID=A0AAN9JJG5_CLITE